MIKLHKWGIGLTLASFKRFKVKILVFLPKKSCSLQRHFKRSELWCFLLGKGILVLGDFPENSVQRWVKRGEWASVGKHKWHQYISDGVTIALEVQYGEECREQDIERF